LVAKVNASSVKKGKEQRKGHPQPKVCRRAAWKKGRQWGGGLLKKRDIRHVKSPGKNGGKTRFSGQKGVVVNGEGNGGGKLNQPQWFQRGGKPAKKDKKVALSDPP